MGFHPEMLAKRFLKRSWDTLTLRERSVLDAVLRHMPLSRNTNREFEDTRTFGERLADRIAAFGGSWGFILLFLAILVAWVVTNSIVLARRHDAFDPYPYILLNLFLSMIAALQAPVIMMSQNRQAKKDRLEAANDYEVNLKSEIEIGRLHEKLDELRENQWADLVRMQQEQIRLLQAMVRASGAPEDPESA